MAAVRRPSEAAAAAATAAEASDDAFRAMCLVTNACNQVVLRLDEASPTAESACRRSLASGASQKCPSRLPPPPPPLSPTAADGDDGYSIYVSERAVFAHANARRQHARAPSISRSASTPRRRSRVVVIWRDGLTDATARTRCRSYLVNAKSAVRAYVRIHFGFEFTGGNAMAKSRVYNLRARFLLLDVLRCAVTRIFACRRSPLTRSLVARFFTLSGAAAAIAAVGNARDTAACVAALGGLRPRKQASKQSTTLVIAIGGIAVHENAKRR